MFPNKMYVSCIHICICTLLWLYHVLNQVASNNNKLPISEIVDRSLSLSTITCVRLLKVDVILMIWQSIGVSENFTHHMKCILPVVLILKLALSKTHWGNEELSKSEHDFTEEFSNKFSYLFVTWTKTYIAYWLDNIPFKL